jgi:predicted nucleotidyltransferase
VDVGAPHRVITSGTDADVLRVLASVTGRLTGRQVARLAGAGAPETVQRSLRRLTALGLVEGEEAGRSRLYRLNRDHLAAPAVLALSSLRAALVDEVRGRVRALDPAPVAAALFGSAARGDGSAESDIDLLVVRPPGVDVDVWADRLIEVGRDLERRTGNRVSIHDITTEDAARLDAERPAVVAEVLRDAVDLLDRPVGSLVAVTGER